MRKYNVAVIVAGINEEYQNTILSGIQEYASRHNNINLAHFVAFNGVLKNENHDKGEYNIFNLPDFAKFDGAVLLTNTLSSPVVTNQIIGKIKDAGITAVSIDDNIPGFFHIGIDNRSAMEQMVRHFTDFHGYRRFKYISGPRDNPESIIRLEAFMNVMKENSIIINEQDIFYGDFRSPSGKDAVEFFLETSDELPDVIICANDVMAISAIARLNKAGFSIPKDVAVSGFDDTYNARNYSPELTSVTRPLSISGRLACRVLINAINNISQNQSIILDMHPRFTKSCNCTDSKCDSFDGFKNRTFKLAESLFSSITLINQMSCQLIECDTLQEYVDYLKQFIKKLNAEEFYLCLCSDWSNDFNSAEFDDGCSEISYTTVGYTEKLLVPLAYINGKFVDYPDFESKEMLPTLFEDKQKSKSYFFIPIHFRERCLGYSVFLNSDFPMNGYMFQSWNIAIGNTLENIRKIINLDSAVHKMNKLYTVDTLSHIYNRTGFTKYAGAVFKQCQKEQSPVMLMFIDMDGLKVINDTYGHKDGDKAICGLAESIRKSCTNGEIFARFGGDEFLVLASSYSESDADELAERIEYNMQAFNDLHDYSFKIGASIGYHISVPEPDTELFQLVTYADNVMYENKKKKKVSNYLKKTK